MKTLILISRLAPGGAERVSVDFARRLAARGHPAHLATVTSRHDSGMERELGPAGVVRHDLGAGRLADPRGVLGLLRLLARERFDVVHAHGQDASILAAVTRLLRPFPLAITRHVLDEPSGDLRQRLRRTAALWAFRQADACVAVSRATADRLASLSGIPRDRIRVIPNGIATERFDHADPGQQDGPLLLLVGVMREGKGHELLLDALPEIRRAVPGARVAFAGSGVREPSLRALAAKHGDAVRFLGHREDVPEVLASSALVVLPSSAEALPTALLEAGAAGRPVVATRVGGTPEVVEDGVTGLLVPPGDPRSLAEAVISLLRDPERGASMGAAGRERIRRLFSLDRQVDATLALWEEIAR